MSVLVDSDVLIEVARGRNHDLMSRWVKLSVSDIPVLYSPVTAAEVWAGALPREQRLIEELFRPMECAVIDEETGRQAGEYLRQFRRSHNVEMGDALIAACAMQSHAALWTRNRKHFPMKGLEFY
ncbi:MAG: type II toxin-antitoxin system VapC family toxin [Acidobacteriaceae bacterium]|jgi:predicted nucleic acid-binding protein